MIRVANNVCLLLVATCHLDTIRFWVQVLVKFMFEVLVPIVVWKVCLKFWLDCIHLQDVGNGIMILALLGNLSQFKQFHTIMIAYGFQSFLCSKRSLNVYFVADAESRFCMQKWISRN